MRNRSEGPQPLEDAQLDVRIVEVSAVGSGRRRLGHLPVLHLLQNVRKAVQAAVECQNKKLYDTSRF